MPRVDHDEDGLETAEHAIRPPEFGQLGRRTRHVVRIILELRLEPLQQCEAIGRRSGEADDYLAVQQLSDLHRVGLHHLRAERHLPIPADRHPVPLADGEDCRRVPVQVRPPAVASHQFRRPHPSPEHKRDAPIPPGSWLGSPLAPHRRAVTTKTTADHHVCMNAMIGGRLQGWRFPASWLRSRSGRGLDHPAWVPLKSFRDAVPLKSFRDAVQTAGACARRSPYVVPFFSRCQITTRILCATATTAFFRPSRFTHRW